WLVYLAMTQSRPIVLSRPQLLVSDLDVIARVDDPAKKAVVEEVYAWHGKKAPLAEGDRIDVDNLDRCRRLPHDNDVDADVQLDWKGPGRYILPLHKKANGSYEVVAIPPSPGFSSLPRPRIYPVTDETLAQLKAIKEAGAAP